MSGPMKVNVTGLKELEDVLKTLPRRVGRAALVRAGLDALEPMARQARANAPVDEGELRESIDVGATAVTDDVGKFAYRLVKGGGGTDAEALAAMRDARRANRSNLTGVTLYMGPAAAADKNEAIKAIAQEFGTERHGPQPYMRPAFDALAASTIERAAENLKFEVYAAAERQARKAR
jgi:HK97 gp10 family phage protein